MRNLALGVTIVVAGLFLILSHSLFFPPTVIIKEDQRHDLQRHDLQRHDLQRHDLQRHDFQQTLTNLQREQYETRLLLNKLYCATKTVLPSGGFCINEEKIVVGGNDVWSAKLCAGLEKLFANATVGDLGAGLGHYGRCFLRQRESMISRGNAKEIKNINVNYERQMKEAGLMGSPQVIRSWHGWDGASNIDEFSGGRIGVADLSVPVDLGYRFDWVMSLEVGEHIPPAGEEAFLDDLVRHACKGVVVSWAVPGQKGHHHVNCRSNEYVRAKMSSRGLKPELEEERKLRAEADLHYFKDTVMVFTFLEKRC